MDKLIGKHIIKLEYSRVTTFENGWISKDVTYMIAGKYGIMPDLSIGTEYEHLQNFRVLLMECQSLGYTPKVAVEDTIKLALPLCYKGLQVAN